MILPEHDYLIRLLSAVIDGIQPQNPPETLDWEKLYQLSIWHGISNMAWYGIMKLIPEHRSPQHILMKFKNEYKLGVAKEATQHIAVEQIIKVFEEHRISCLPLKGCLVKYLYPRPDMRQMADIDILIKDEQAEQIKELLLDMGFTVKHQGGNHDIYHRKPYMNLEMHRKLISDGSPYSAYLSKTWDRAGLKPDCQYTYRLSDEDLYIYLIIHLTKHYIGGGTGIRSFMDICLYNRWYKQTMDWNYIWTELEKIGLREFAENIIGLCGVWFEGAESKGLYHEMADYILYSGVYGTKKHAVIASMNIKTNNKYSIRIAKILYVLKLFFPPLNTMKILYPFLETVPFLLPVSWVLRGIRCLLFKRKHTLQMIHEVHSVSEKDMIKIGSLHEKAGLSMVSLYNHATIP
ncbi:nucleotidyltransferase domain-containing protein [Desulfoscipio sp. XC116]|uniref:nucleotidyltransferase domain-containing protein n=1 Tax=Desulfoscipio sp. XC116 TaxID=3144975 RepID=UPI00325BAB5A